MSFFTCFSNPAQNQKTVFPFILLSKQILLLKLLSFRVTNKCADAELRHAHLQHGHTRRRRKERKERHSTCLWRSGESRRRLVWGWIPAQKWRWRNSCSTSGPDPETATRDCKRGWRDVFFFIFFAFLRRRFKRTRSLDLFTAIKTQHFARTKEETEWF